MPWRRAGCDCVSEDGGGGREAPLPPGLRVRILGAGTLGPDDEHRSAAHLDCSGWGVVGGRRSEEWELLLDCCFGAVHGFSRFGIDPRRADPPALSHFHLDSLWGIWLPFSSPTPHASPCPRTTPFTLVGPPRAGEPPGRPGAALRWLHPPPSLLPPGGGGASLERQGGRTRWVVRPPLCPHPTTTPEAVASGRVEAASGSCGGLHPADRGTQERGWVHFLGRVRILLISSSAPSTDPSPWNGHPSPVGVARLAREARPGLTVPHPPLPRCGWHRPPPTAPEGGVGGAGGGEPPTEIAWIPGRTPRSGPPEPRTSSGVGWRLDPMEAPGSTLLRGLLLGLGPLPVWGPAMPALGRGSFGSARLKCLVVMKHTGGTGGLFGSGWWIRSGPWGTMPAPSRVTSGPQWDSSGKRWPGGLGPPGGTAGSP